MCCCLLSKCSSEKQLSQREAAQSRQHAARATVGLGQAKAAAWSVCKYNGLLEPTINIIISQLISKQQLPNFCEVCCRHRRGGLRHVETQAKLRHPQQAAKR